MAATGDSIVSREVQPAIRAGSADRRFSRPPVKRFDAGRAPTVCDFVQIETVGAWYRANFAQAIASEEPLLSIEMWNELHEASGVGESKEYGRLYIELTAELVREYKESPADAD